MPTPKHQNLVLWFTTLLFLFGLFHNCAPSQNNSPSIPRFQESGNGGGYAGPNTVFPLIPAIDPTESMSTADLQTKLNQAQLRCLIGAPERGLMGITAKLQKIIINKPHLPCELFAVGDFQTLKTIYGYSYDYTSDQDLKRYCQQDYPLFYSRRLNTLTSNNDQLIFPGAIEFGAYDSTVDPQSLATDPTWTKPRFRFWINDQNFNPLKHFHTVGEFPMAMYSSAVDPSSTIDASKKKIILLFSDFVSETQPLVDTLANTNAGATFNTFEYMSCVQGEFYFAQDLSVESAQPMPIPYPNELQKNPRCPILDPWIESLNNRKSFELSRNRFETQFQMVFQSWADEYNIRKKTAQLIFEDYLDGKIDLNDIRSCISQSPDRADFLYTLQSVFFFKSIEKLKVYNDTLLTDFLNQLSSSTNGNIWTMFYVSGVGGETSDTKAGIHREKLSTFMNLLRIPKEDWLTVFVHEMRHRLDVTMFDASARFTKTETISSIRAELQKPSPNEQILRGWIVDGLQRGLLAEYRAWWLSLKTYKSLLNANTIKPSPWLEGFLRGHSPADADFDCALLNILAKQDLVSTIPEFADPKIKSLTTEILADIRSCKSEYLIH